MSLEQIFWYRLQIAWWYMRPLLAYHWWIVWTGKVRGRYPAESHYWNQTMMRLLLRRLHAASCQSGIPWARSGVSPLYYMPPVWTGVCRQVPCRMPSWNLKGVLSLHVCGEMLVEFIRWSVNIHPLPQLITILVAYLHLSYPGRVGGGGVTNKKIRKKKKK